MDYFWYTLMMLLILNNNSLDKIKGNDNSLDKTKGNRMLLDLPSIIEDMYTISKRGAGGTPPPLSLEKGMGTQIVRQISHYCRKTEKTFTWRLKLFSNKIRNRNVRAYNGNRVLRNLIKIGHWNAGNGAWDKKRIELEALVLQKSPDILFVSEANLWDTLPDTMRNINGYDLFIPQAMMQKHKYAQIVLLVRSGVDIQVKEELMHEDISMIWISLNYSPRKKMTIGGVYREHQHLFCPKPNPSLTDAAQLERWMLILNSWKIAALDPLCTVIGDINLNFLNGTLQNQNS